MHVLIIYSTQTGTTQMVADTAKKALSNYRADVVHASSTTVDDIKSVDAVIFAIPTYDEGQPEVTARPLLEDLKQQSGVNKPYAIIAPGDTSYPEFAGAAQDIKAAADQAGMKEVQPALKIDGYAFNVATANQEIEQWIRAFTQQLNW